MGWRLLGFVLAVAVLTGCDGYVEQVTVDPDGSVAFAARATVVCRDELQQAIWQGSACDVIDAAARGDRVGELPFDVELDQDRVGLIADGEQDRRRVDATWDGPIEELRTLLVESASAQRLDETRTELRFTTAGAPVARLRSTADLASMLDESGWPPAEFRVVAPDLITDHNADDVQGRTVTWRFDGDHPGEFVLVWTTEDPPTRYWWWLIGGAVLMAVLYMMIALESDGRDHDVAEGG